uniref:Neprosin PEP catalytic domain-containing protein n=1 Tax=Brassica oleracea TaxID=3712 RepID=A0A3P6FAI3_BRAOL|nr:unnamed protein product [Brassica oleracea]
MDSLMPSSSRSFQQTKELPSSPSISSILFGEDALTVRAPLREQLPFFYDKGLSRQVSQARLGAWALPLKFSDTFNGSAGKQVPMETLASSGFSKHPVSEDWPALAANPSISRKQRARISSSQAANLEDASSPSSAGHHPTYLEDGTPMVCIPPSVLLKGLDHQREFIVGQFMNCSAPSGGLIHGMATRIWGPGTAGASFTSDDDLIHRTWGGRLIKPSLKGTEFEWTLVGGRVAEAARRAILSQEEKKELERQLKAINKPAIKSFKQTEHDEIFDCIDIHKQLAFDHHLLKNHTVQMKPTSVPKWNTSNNNSQKVDPLQLLPRGISCPDGTVIVKRTTMQDLLKVDLYDHVYGNAIDLTGHHFATVDYEYSTVSGVKGNINLWDLQVSQDQVSLATMAIAGGPIENLASISVGWMVNPLLYQDHIHLYTYWTADGYKKTGCYDIRCPGFVQVSKRIPLGVLKPVSIYDGTQYQMELSLHQDHATGDWWFIFGGVNVGYWPKSLFIASGLAKGTDKTSRGGQVYSPLTKKSPFVGSGHFPNEGMGKAAFINGIEIIDGKGETLIPQIYTIKTHESSPNCYKAKFIHDDDDPWIRAVFYGGPGGCTGQLSSEESEAVALIVVAKSDRTMPVEMEENELVSLLNSINKPAVTSFQTEHGDILDCIDINKQLAFDHPLLKNHTIQLRPRNIPKWTVNNSTSKNGGSMPFRQDDISCPFGTVVVKRTTHEDLILSQRLKSTGSKYLTYVTSKDKNIDLTGFHFAMAEYGHNNYGAKVNLSIWEPKVSPTQFSSASMLIGGGSKEQFQSIRAGWIVYQWLNRNHSRLYTYWTADGFTKTGCYNTLCPGFVQVSKRVPLGILLEPVSVYDGHQSEVGIVIYKDVVTGNWWLFVHDEMVGYWPNSLFTKSGLGHGAGLVSYGGEVYSPVNEKSPGMGSGHFPAEGYTKAAYVNGFEVVCNNDSIFSEPSFPVMMFANTPKCYRVMPGRGQLRVWFDSLFYGGPGGCV